MAITPDWAAMAPVLVLAAFALLLFVVDSIDPDSSNNALLGGLAALGTGTAAVVTVVYLFSGVGQTSGAVSLYDGQLVVDGMALLFTVIFTSVATLVCVASVDYLEGQQYQAEYYMLVLLATLGMSLMATAGSLATVFVALELASLPSYALVAFLKNNRGSVEAGLKYFLIGALASAIFAYGISLVYGVAGALNLAAVASAVADTELSGILGVGILMVTVGFAFKTASAPVLLWAPEA